jgi:hypothetical protein
MSRARSVSNALIAFVIEPLRNCSKTPMCVIARWLRCATSPRNAALFTSCSVKRFLCDAQPTRTRSEMRMRVKVCISGLTLNQPEAAWFMPCSESLPALFGKGFARGLGGGVGWLKMTTFRRRGGSFGVREGIFGKKQGFSALEGLSRAKWYPSRTKWYGPSAKWYPSRAEW